MFYPKKIKKKSPRKSPYQEQQSKLKFHSGVANQRRSGRPRQRCKQNKLSRAVMEERGRGRGSDCLLSADEGGLGCTHSHSQKRHRLKDTHHTHLCAHLQTRPPGPVSPMQNVFHKWDCGSRSQGRQRARGSLRSLHNTTWHWCIAPIIKSLFVSR